MTAVTVVVPIINVPERLALRDDMTLGDIRCFLDEDGDETDVEENAAVAIVEWRDGGWTPLLLSDYVTQRSN